MTGILGGTFDPPHNGHIALAEAAISKLELSRVIFIPASVPPHKERKIATPREDRLAMLRLAVRGRSEFEVSEIEFERSGPSYAVDTIKSLKKISPSETFYYLVGADNVVEMEGWYRPDEIFELVTVAAANRPGFNPEGRFAGMVEYFDMPEVDISSSMIRERVKAGKSVSRLVHPSVEEYILRKGLYKNNG